jgi:transposase
MLMVSVSYVSKVLGRRRRSGEPTARPRRCHVPPKLAEYHAATLRARVSTCPDATVAELQAWMQETHKDTKGDETATKTNMIGMWGRSQRGVRLIDTTPHGHWKTSSFIAGLRVDGLVAPCVLDGAINGELFRSYVAQVLVPTLAKDDVVAMDNLACHKVAGVRKAIEAVGATIRYLPAQSPDLNPIEMVFAKIKALLRAKASGRWAYCGRPSGQWLTASPPPKPATSSATPDISSQGEDALATLPDRSVFLPAHQPV